MLLKQWIVTVGRSTPGKFSKGRSQEKTQLQRLDFSAAWVVRSNLNDPRRISYLLVWKDEIHGGGIKEAVRLAGYVEPSNSRVTDDCVDLKRTDGSATVLRIVWRMLPWNGGRALFLLCPYCETPRRHVYGWEWDSTKNGGHSRASPLI